MWAARQPRSELRVAAPSARCRSSTVITRSTRRPEAVSRARSIPGSSPDSRVVGCTIAPARGRPGWLAWVSGKFAPFVHQYHVVGAGMPLRPFLVTAAIGRLAKQGAIRRRNRLSVHAEPLHPRRAVVVLEGRT